MSRTPRLRRLALSSALVVTAGALAACNSASPTSDTSASGSASASASASGATKAKGPITIYSQWKEGQPGQKLMQSIADDFTKATGAEVKMVWKGNEVSSSLVPTLNTDNVPADMVETSNAQIQSLLYPTGGLLELTDAYAMKAEGSDKTIGEIVGTGGKDSSTIVDAAGQSTGRVVTIPYWAYARGVWFYNGATNKDLVGKEPKTWEEMTALLGKLKSGGKAPIALDGGVNSYNYEFYGNLVRSLAGQDAMIKAFSDKSANIWDKPEYLKAAEMVAELPTKGYFLEGFDASKFPAEQQRWANNEAVFSVNGSWLPGEVAKVAAPDFQFKSFLFPPVSGKGNPGLNWGTSGFAILKASKNPETAKMFAGFALQSKYQDRVATEMGNIPLAPGAKVPDSIASVKKAIDSGKDLLPVEPTGYADWSNKVVFPNTTKVTLGTMPSAEFIATMKQATVDYWKAKG